MALITTFAPYNSCNISRRKFPESASGVIIKNRLPVKTESTFESTKDFSAAATVVNHAQSTINITAPKRFDFLFKQPIYICVKLSAFALATVCLLPLNEIDSKKNRHHDCECRQVHLDDTDIYPESRSKNIGTGELKRNIPVTNLRNAEAQ